MSVALMSPTQYSLAYREPSDKGYIEIVTNTTKEYGYVMKSKKSGTAKLT